MVLVKPCDSLAPAEMIAADAMTSEAVWTRIHSDLARIYGDLRFGPDNIDNLRAFESTLRLQAATGAALGLDARAMTALTACIAAASHEQVVDEVVRGCQRHRREFAWRQTAEAWIREVLTAGYTPALLDASNAMLVCASHISHSDKRFQAVRRHYDRQSLRRSCQALVAVSFILQRLTVDAPVLVAPCAALALSVGIMERTLPLVRKRARRSPR